MKIKGLYNEQIDALRHAAEKYAESSHYRDYNAAREWYLYSRKIIKLADNAHEAEEYFKTICSSLYKQVPFSFHKQK